MAAYFTWLVIVPTRFIYLRVKVTVLKVKGDKYGKAVIQKAIKKQSIRLMLI